MNFTKYLKTLVLLFAFGFSAAGLKAQCTSPPLITNNQDVCEECVQSVGNINVYNFPFNPLAKVFTISAGYNNPCQIVDWVWSTGDEGAEITAQRNQARIIFSQSGTYQVRVRIYFWSDLNGNGSVDPNELCEMCEEIIVTV